VETCQAKNAVRSPAGALIRSWHHSARFRSRVGRHQGREFSRVPRREPVEPIYDEDQAAYDAEFDSMARRLPNKTPEPA
jgi:hypothetical protein